MGTTLTGKIVADTYDALIKVTDNNTITGTKKRMTDGLGNDTPLLISSTDVQVDGNFLTESVQFNTATLQTADAVGKLAWNDQDGTLDLRLKGGNVTLQIGQEELARVVNKTGINLLESEYKAVKVDGAQGNRLKVALAQANNDANSAETIGIVTENIADNQEGFITTNGLVRGINTTGSIQGETWADGDMLYLSGTVAGQLTNIKPVAPIHTVIMGYVVSAHITQGQIYVKVDNGYELDELHNVLISTPANGQVLAYESASGLWKNTTNGNIGGSGTTNYLPKFTGSTTLGNSLIYDNGTNVGIGTSSPISIGGHTGVLTLYGSNATALVLQDSVSRKELRLNDGNLNFTNSGGTSHFYIADGGGVGINSTSTTGITLRLEKSITGASVAYGVYNGGVIQSDVTGSSNHYLSFPSTQAASFTLGTLRHYQTDQGTFGAGSTITNQVGFNANSTLTGATNNYGFRGQIAAASGRWNLYMDGTANNYLAGSLCIGTTSPLSILHLYRYNTNSTLSPSNTSSLIIQNNYGGASGTGGALFFKSDTGTNNTFAGVGGDLSGSSVAGSNGSLVFGTKAADADTNLTIRMRIKANGIVNLSNVPTSTVGLVSGDIYKTVAGVLMIV